MDEKRFVGLIADFVKTTPPETIQLVVDALARWDSQETAINQVNLLNSIHSPETKARVNKLLEAWRQEFPQLPPQGLALAINSSWMTLDSLPESTVELVWSGPNLLFPLRRTDQALLELINGARHRLLLVSFAVYKVQPIVEALENALRRNVEVIICLEDAAESQGKVSFSGIKAFSSSLFRLASFYDWPVENRPHSQDGRFGSLHAKVAVADRARALISSANLTEYAMDMNIEMGVLLEDEGLGEKIDRLFADMIIRGILRPGDSAKT